MPSDPYQSAIARLNALAPLRVWSVLVSVFGDLSLDTPLSGPALTAIMGEIGIKPEATRVALHRLRADGWILSEKRGRTSQHRLSDKGRAGSAAARPRIYGPTPPDGALRFLFLPPSAKAPDTAHFSKLADRLYLGLIGTPPPNGALVLNSADMPDWIAAEIEPPALRASYAALHGALAKVVDDVSRLSTQTPLGTAALRVSIVHAWRRLALKHPALPRAVHSPQWRGADCREQVLHLLDVLPRPDLQEIAPPR